MSAHEPTALLLADLDNAQRRARGMEEALRAINDIRDTIVACQGVNWSRDIYALVAALDAAGFEGRDYEDAKAWHIAGRPGSTLEPYDLGLKLDDGTFLPSERERRAASEAAALPPEATAEEVGG